MNIEDVLTERYFRYREMCSWLPHVRDEFDRTYIRNLRKFLRWRRESGDNIYPAAEQVFRALEVTPLSRVKVVIIGQDPYHNGQADGLAFSTSGGSSMPVALRVIIKAINYDDSIPGNMSTCGRTYGLYRWANQGVLLLNTVLSVREGSAKSHYYRGWEQFTDKIVEAINERRRNVVFLLWGKEAQKKLVHICREKHHVLCAPHPTARDAALKEEFKEDKHFSKANRILEQFNLGAINWCLP